MGIKGRKINKRGFKVGGRTNILAVAIILEAQRTFQHGRAANIGHLL